MSNETFETEANDRVDALFVIDDSPAMAAMHDKLLGAFPSFITAFASPSRGGYPDLHVAVVTTSLGGGRFANVPGCEAGGEGARDGAFRHPAAAGLAAGDTFMRFNGSPLNFAADPGVVFSALADVGTGGCPYPQPLAAARRALARAQDPADPDNGGFLRADARLLVVVVTDQDDCSVPADSDLFDPSQTSTADPYGGAGTYRCAEFGLLCGGVKPPHVLTGGASLTLDACVPAEAAGLLTPIADLTNDLLHLKRDPDEVGVSLIGGPAGPFVIGQQPVPLAAGVTEDQPRLLPSCAGPAGEPAFPGVRLKAWADGFAANGVFLPACVGQDQLASAVIGQLGQLPIGPAPHCLGGAPLANDSGGLDCQVTQTSVDADGGQVQWMLPRCDSDRTVLPCWKIDPDAPACSGAGPSFTVCRNPACTTAPALTPQGVVAVQCRGAC